VSGLLNSHDSRLQSMRGIAAITVLVGHCLLTFKNGRIEDAAFHLKPDNLLLAALQLVIHPNSAVIFFYVLSGLVLGESLRRSSSSASRADRFLGFSIRRIFRLYPAMIPSILAAAIMLTMIVGNTIPGMTATMATAMKTTFDVASLIRNFLGIEYGINPLLWSVQVEIVMIAILPILIVISNRSSLALDLIVLAVLVAVSLVYWNPLPNPLRFVYCFHLGLILPRLIANTRLRPVLRSSSAAIAGIVIMIPIEWLYVRGSLWLPYKFLSDSVISAQWIAFVLLRAELPAVKLLARRPLIFLGDISYSTNNQATVLELFLIVATAAAALPLAAASHRLIELPLIAVGRRLSATWTGMRTWSRNNAAPIQGSSL
jgi:peptidoglycan/LPS O-acetylase OafA/YrhL